MRILIAGIGALGGTIATRALAAGMPVSLATRTEASAAALRCTGLRVSGVGGDASAATVPVAALGDSRAEAFDLIVLATGSSNLGATMHAPGVYEQRNAGHLLIGEIAGGPSERAAAIARALAPAVNVRVTGNLSGAVWAKLLLNCSVTTIGALAGQTMREYMRSPAGSEVFRRAYHEALAVALASGARPERMLVDPVPPRGAGYQPWLEQVLSAYGDLKPSMLQDLERGRRTEIDFINGDVARLGAASVPAPVNAAITAMVHRMERGEIRPAPARLDELLRGE